MPFIAMFHAKRNVRQVPSVTGRDLVLQVVTPGPNQSAWWIICTMDADSVRKFVRTLPGTVETATNTARWGDKIVFRVGDQAAGGKMFCQIDFEADGRAILSFAANPERFDELLELDGVIPAPYRARLHWVALTRWNAIGDLALKGLLRDAMALTLAKLPKKTRESLTKNRNQSARPGPKRA